MDIEFLDFKKIKNTFSDSEQLQGKFVQAQLKYQKFEALRDKTIGSRSIEDNKFILSIKDETKKLEALHGDLMEELQNDLQYLITFQDKLTKNYKQFFIDKLKKIALSTETTKNIGLSYINDKKISKIVNSITFIPSLSINNWSNLLDTLQMNNSFLNCMNKVEAFYRNLLEKHFNRRLAEIPENTEKILIEEYKEAFFKDPTLTFNTFIRNLKTKLTEEEFEKRRTLIENTKKTKELEKLKQQQKEQTSTLNDYFKYSDKEFQRRRRKKQRKSLSEIAQEPLKEQEIDDKKKEKIEKFKSKFEDSFEKKYLLQEEDLEDPLDLIRKRKKEKDKEYKNFIDKFKKERSDEDFN
ncbi:MAG: hypothetical protein BAJALOKI1v1_210014 [Promethearchaeota archaeon]|nr:MAG: hypothetical protein BAJALOKI1v1_210014 [Candidatus Lokiarchaeota archaeon]